MQIFEVNIPDQSGTYIHATVFKSKTATAENPAPVVVTCNGYADTGEKQDFAAIELSRRGVVVFEMDALSHGLSSTSTYDRSPASTMGEAVGMISLVEFISNAELDYIDLSRLGITGHSMGGIATRVTYEHFGALETAALEAARLPESDGGEEITDAEFEFAESLNVISAALFQSALPMPDVGAYANYYRIFFKPGKSAQACRKQYTPLLVTFYFGRAAEEKPAESTGIFIRHRQSVKFKFQLMPFIFIIYKQAAIQPFADDKTAAESFTELCGHEKAAFYVNSMLIFTH